MHKQLATLVLVATTALALAGCSAENTAEYPAAGRWASIKEHASGKLVGDVWCIGASSRREGSSFDCQWSSLTDPGTHEGSQEVSGIYRYVMAADGKEHRILCVTYSLRKNPTVTNCNWNSLAPH